VASGLCAVVTACGGSPAGPSPSGVLTLTSVFPVAAPGGSAVTLFGSGFAQGAGVTFGGVPGIVGAISTGQLSVVTPHVTSGTVDVVVTNPGGAPVTLSRGFTFTPFEITEVQPNQGFPGLRFWVTGTGLLPGARVSIGGIDVTQNSVLNSIVGLAPTHDLGPADVVVTNPGGRTVTLPGGFTYRPSPVISVNATTVPAGGQLVVSWVVPLTSGLDWIGLYRVGADNFSAVSFRYIDGLSGSTTFTAPLEPGSYEFRYLPLDRYDVCARTQTVTVTPPAQGSR
jgi:hypothetical protein